MRFYAVASSVLALLPCWATQLEGAPLPPDLHHAVVVEMPKAWSQLTNPTDVVSGSLRGSSLDDRGIVVSEFETIYKRRPGHIVIDNSGGKPDVPRVRIAYLMNERYEAILKYHSNRGGWAISEFQTRNQSSDNTQLHNRVKEYALNFISDNMRVYGAYLPSVWPSAQFYADGTRRVSEGGRNLVEVRFSTGPSTKPTFRGLNATAQFDTVISYAPVKYTATVDQGSGQPKVVVEGEWTYRNEGGTILPVSKQQVFRRLDSAEPLFRNSVSEYKSSVETHIPDYHFTLSAFGLPEPPGVEWERPTPYWLYLLAAAAVFALAAVVFRRLARRPRPATP